MDIEKMKKILKSIETIKFTKHCEIRLKQRKIKKKDIQKFIKDPKKLSIVEYQGKQYNRNKYLLLYNKSRRYDLKIVVSIKNKDLNVITVHIQNKGRKKRYEKWRKRRK